MAHRAGRDKAGGGWGKTDSWSSVVKDFDVWGYEAGMGPAIRADQAMHLNQDTLHRESSKAEGITHSRSDDTDGAPLILDYAFGITTLFSQTGASRHMSGLRV